LVSNELLCGFQAIAAIIVFDYRRDFNPVAVSRTCLLSSPPTSRMATDHTSIYGERCNVPRFLPFSFFSLAIFQKTPFPRSLFVIFSFTWRAVITFEVCSTKHQNSKQKDRKKCQDLEWVLDPKILMKN
jgi:hypothetical protein